MESNIMYILNSILQMPLFALIVAVLELMAMGILALCGVCDIKAMGNNEQMAYLTLILAQIFAFCIVQILFCFWKKWENHEALWKSRLGFGCICTGCFAGMVLMAGQIVNLNTLGSGRLMIWIFMTALNLLSYIFYFISKEKSRVETENRVYQKQSVLYQEWYEGFQQTRKETLAFRHDMNNHLGVLKYLCSNGDDGKESVGALAEINQYIDSLGINYNKSAYDSASGNMMVDFAVDMKKNFALTKGIPMEVDLFIPREMKYSSMDLVIFLSNLLDNAIEACERMMQVSYEKNEKREPKIILKLQYQMGNLVVLIQNTYDGNLDGENSNSKGYFMLQTSKEDKGAHGIGMKNVMDIVEKYNGVVRWNADNGWFTINALLYEFDENDKKDKKNK